MKIANAKMPCQQPARRPNRPCIEKVLKWYLPAAAVAWLLSAEVGVSVGGCIDDPYKFPSLGCFFKSNPSFHHRRDDASGTLCAPCYGYHPTCWRPWPDCCVGCPPPPVSISTQPPEAPLQNLPSPEAMPTPEVIPAPMPPPAPLPPGSATISPAPTTTPQRQRPANLTPLSPATSRVNMPWALPGNPQVPRLPELPVPPGVRADAVPRPAPPGEWAARPGDDFDIAPMPPELPRMKQDPLAPMPGP